MEYYYVNNNAQPNGDHEVHKEICKVLPTSRTYLGFFSNCYEAVAEANKKFPGKADGCAWCCPDCHKR